MARVILTEEARRQAQLERKIKNLGPWVKGRLGKNTITKGELAKVLGITTQGLGNKLRSERAFTAPEIMRIFFILGTPPDDITDAIYVERGEK